MKISRIFFRTGGALDAADSSPELSKGALSKHLKSVLLSFYRNLVEYVSSSIVVYVCCYMQILVPARTDIGELPQFRVCALRELFEEVPPC
jgi:hypothetical protein